MTAERRARLLLAVGAAAGLATAAASLVGGRAGTAALSPDVVATVNDAPIRRDDYLRALGAVATDRRAPIGDADKRQVLDRLIDEELLLQHGLDLGLPRRDRSVRAPLVAATIDLLASAAAEPSEADLRAFYDQHRAYFAPPERLRVRQILVQPHDGDEAGAAARAADAARRLRAGEPFDQVRAALGDAEVAPIPDTALPPGALREYVGESAARAALAADAGGVTDPQRSSMGFHVLLVLARTAPPEPPFEEVKELVREEYRRRADDTALRAGLDDLRRAARVQVTDALP